MAKVCLITGCSSGLGRALALRLAAERRDGQPAFVVYATARNTSSLKDLESQGIRTLQLDVTNQKSVDQAVKKVVQEAGRIDLLINNAGVGRVGPLVEQPMSEVEEVFAANFFGAVRVTQAVAPHMMRQRSGLILMIGSVVSMLSSPFGAAYSASKAALLALSDCLRLELLPFGVHVSYVAAGAIKSAFATNIAGGSGIARYEKPSSLYAPLADMIRDRVNISQDPQTSMDAAAVADQIIGTIKPALLPPPPSRSALAAIAAWCASALRFGSRGAAVADAADSGAAEGQAAGAPATPIKGKPGSPPASPANSKSGTPPASPAPSLANGSVNGSVNGAVADGTAAKRVWRPTPPPTWFLAGGNARQYWLMGVVQKLLPGGWPVNSMLARRFKLDAPLPS